ncbi:uncharacterized protein [Amphiura filiformis]|uniref:uncharacterized protein n=1 Tax=Amphiura filiformis TaxID=82378 RepID=UPI003B21143D
MDVKQISMMCLIAAVIGRGSAIQCHECHYQNLTQPGLNFQQIIGQSGCMDPFQSSEVEMVECDGHCYANVTKQSLDTFTLEAIYRGCTTGSGVNCDFQGCQNIPSTKVCSYCCDDDDGCNSRSFEEADAGVFKCHYCQAELTPDGMPVDSNTCGRDNFDGTGAFDIALPCPSETCITLTIPSSPDTNATITRGCATVDTYLGLCTKEDYYESFGYNIECCYDNLCNVGENSPTDMPPLVKTTKELPTTPKPNDNKSSCILPNLFLSFATLLALLLKLI